LPPPEFTNGEPYGAGNQKSENPVRAIDERTGVTVDHDEGNSSAPGGDRSLATEPDGGECGFGPEAFVEGLATYADRIDLFATLAEKENLPKVLRLEESLIRLEFKANAIVRSAEQFELPESNVLRACGGT
jgi:hypothetical protein